MIRSNLTIAMVAEESVQFLRGLNTKATIKKIVAAIRATHATHMVQPFYCHQSNLMIGVAKFFYSCHIYGMPEKVD